MSFAMRMTGGEILPDPRRVLLRDFHPGNDVRAKRILDFLDALSPSGTETTLREVMDSFQGRHRDLAGFWTSRARRVLGAGADGSDPRRLLLVGAFFSSEYSVESAALFNPCAVPHPDQGGLASGELRVLLSLRATGEGHLSSVGFRVGILGAEGDFAVEPAGRFVTPPEKVVFDLCDKEGFLGELARRGGSTVFASRLLEGLPDPFDLSSLQERLRRRDVPEDAPGREDLHAAGRMVALASARYRTIYSDRVPLSERTLFPAIPDECAGIEDARFVRFTDDGGSVRWVATVSAYDGRRVVPRWIETEDFLAFDSLPLSGAEATNKGMALFPRKIAGKFLMLSRQDGENLFLMESDRPTRWDSKRLLARPRSATDLTQIGNCGSPIETPEGWLVLTHGVGAMRRYHLDALLLDLERPERVVARLPSPLLRTGENDREGYVPNVVYSCGGLLHRGNLFLPYARCDSSIAFATVPWRDLLGAMRPERAGGPG